MTITHRKKPIEIEARKFEGSTTECMTIAEWVRANGYPWLVGNALFPKTLVPETGGTNEDPGIYIDPETGNLIIRTLEGDMRVSYGDWIIKGVKGEFYPCKPDIFEQSYERIES